MSPPPPPPPEVLVLIVSPYLPLNGVHVHWVLRINSAYVFVRLFL